MENPPFLHQNPQDCPGYLMWQTTTLWKRAVRKVLDPYGISQSQFAIMAVLLWLEQKGENATQTRVVQMSQLDKMTISKSVRKLIEEKYVKQSEKDQDLRAKWLCLTRNGKYLIRELIPLVEIIDKNFFGDALPDIVKALQSLLYKSVGQGRSSSELLADLARTVD